MAYSGWACFGGTELFNMGRLAQMLGIGMGPEGLVCNDLGQCPDLDVALGYAGGYNPSENPWYDPLEPASADFAGLLVTSITGLEPGAFVRPVIEKAGVGAVLGQGRQNAPQIVVTGILMARTCEAQEFGYRWLRKALKGSCRPATVCAGDDLVYLSAQPNFPDEDCGPVDYPAYLEPYFRTFKGAALIDGPKINSIVARACPSCSDCGMYEVQFTLSAADPCVYREPITLIDDAIFVCDGDGGACVGWAIDGTDCTDDCPPDAPCATDPNCVDIPPPAMPTLVASCVTDCITQTACNVSVQVPDGTFPLSAEGTLIVSIFAGDLPLSNIELQVWENPLGLALADLDDCAMCASLAISYVAAGATLVIDGTARSATINCVGGSTVRANPYIVAGTGTANFSYPTFVCGSDYLVNVSAHSPVSPLASVSIFAVPREC